MDERPLLHLLGVVRFGDGPTETMLAGVQPRTVLALSALRAGRPVTTDELAEALWPDGPGLHWSGALRGVIAKVRAFLSVVGPEPPTLDNVGHGYCFTCHGTTDVDVQRARRDLEAAEQLVACGRARDAAEMAASAVRLLDAPLLPDLEATWLERYRAELARDLLRALRVASAAESARGNHGEAVRLASAAVERDPYDESSHRMLMEAHRIGGNRATALRSYGACRKILADDLGVTPSEETERCYLQLLDTAAGTRVGPAQAAPRDSAMGDSAPWFAGSPFVGRSPELAVLARAWSTARAGRRQIVVVQGDAGAGKTRLSLEVARRSDPAHVLYGRSSPEQVVAFEPFTEAIGRHLTQLDDDRLAEVVGRDAPDLAGVIPVVAERCRVEPEFRADTDRRQRALDAVRSVLSRISSEPTVLVIDDLHWADASTLLLLRHLLRALGSARLLVIATYRDDEVPDPALAEALTHLHRMEGCHALRLGGLDAAEVTQLLSGSEIPDAGRHGPLLQQRTGGNPFYLGQVLSAATEGSEAFDPLKVPDTVSELVRHRVVSLPVEARDVLALAATIGTAIRRDVLDEALSIEGCTPTAVDVLVQRRLLMEIDDDLYAFVHALARDAVYGQMPRARRRRLHLTVARAIDVVAAGAPSWAAALSHHYLLADDPAHATEAVDATIRAADHASDVLAYEQAIELYSDALTALDRFGLDDPRAASIHLGLGAAQRRLGHPASARTSLEAWIALARAPGQERVFAEAVLELVAKGGRGVAVDMADTDRADLLSEAAERLGTEDDALRVSLLAELSLALLLTDQVERRQWAAELAHRIASENGRADVVARGVVAQRLLFPRPDGAAARLVHTDRLVGPDRRHVEPEQLARLHMWRLTDCFELGDRVGVERELAALCAQARNLDQPYWLWLAGTWQALHAWIDGHEDTADELALAALDHVADLDHPETMLAYGIQLVGFRIQQGRTHEIVDLLAGAANDNPAVPAMRCVLAFALARSGRDAAAADLLRELAADDFAALPQDSNWPICIVSLAETSCLLGDDRTAALLLPLLEPFRDQLVVVSAFGAGGGCWGPYSATLAALRARVGDREGAASDLEHATASVAAFGSPPMCRRVAALAEELGG